MTDFTDGKAERVALVTGASSGLGRIMAEALVREGYRVFGTSRSPAHVTPAHDIRFMAMDVDSDASVEEGVASVIDQAGRLDLLLCSAGFGVMGPVEDTPVADMIAQFETNVFGVHRVCRTALPHLRKQPDSKLIVVGSLAGMIGLPYQGLYSASKFALEGYCEALRIELRDSSVRVALLQPGDFPTGFTSSRKLIGGDDISAAHRAKFAKAMAVVEADETDGGELSLLADAIARLVADPTPPLRTIVASPEQVELAEAKPSTDPGEWEALIAEHYGLEQA